MVNHLNNVNNRNESDDSVTDKQHVAAVILYKTNFCMILTRNAEMLVCKIRVYFFTASRIYHVSAEGYICTIVSRKTMLNCFARLSADLKIAKSTFSSLCNRPSPNVPVSVLEIYFPKMFYSLLFPDFKGN